MKPVVSIWCLTYNHEKYIRDALEGFLAQKTNFPYEIVVHDDASTDGTTVILKEYEEKYPDLIRVIYEKENQYRKGNLRRKLRRICPEVLRGKYIASCEGDDCWIDEKKLQMQVDYLEEHPECMLTMHDAVRVNCKNGSIGTVHAYESGDKIVTAEEIIMQSKGHPPTASFVSRRETRKMADFFYSAPVGDYPLQLSALANGYIYYFSRVMSVYRAYSTPFANSSWQAADARNELTQAIGLIKFLEKYDQYTENRYHKNIISKINSLEDSIAYQIFNELISDECKSHINEQNWDIENLMESFSDLEILEKKLTNKKYSSAEVQALCKMLAGKSRNNDLYQLCYWGVQRKIVEEMFQKHKKIYLYGAGRVGMRILNALEQWGCVPNGFVVSDGQRSFLTLRGIKVYELSELADDENIAIIITVGKALQREIEETLKNRGFLNNCITI